MHRRGGDLVSSPSFTDRHPDGAHPDVGDLADEVAGVAAPAVADHLLACPDCTARLAALTAASTAVTRDLRADPEPELPAALAARFARVIAEESAARGSRAALEPAVTRPDRPPVGSARRRDGWWARHTRLGGVLVTAAALAVVGGGGTVVSHWVRSGQPANQAAGTGTPQPEAGAAGNDLRRRTSPPLASAGTIALNRTAFTDEVASLLRSRTARALTSAEATCATHALARTDRNGATLTALPGAVTVDGTPVVVVVDGHAGARTAMAISGCSTGDPKVVARGNLP
jgi:hypothetical protein